MEMAGWSTVMSGSATGVLRVGQGLADHDVRDAGTAAQMSPPATSAGLAGERLGHHQPVDADVLDRPVALDPRDGLALAQLALLDASSAMRPRKLSASRFVTCA